MKNVMFIDEAPNCAYDIFSVSEEVFRIIFPNIGQNIEFIENIMENYSKKEFNELFTNISKFPIIKKEVQGIDGILFFQLRKQKSKFYPNKKDSDLDGWARGWISDPNAPPVNTPEFMSQIFR